jgi:dienelactone hydrolase
MNFPATRGEVRRLLGLHPEAGTSGLTLAVWGQGEESVGGVRIRPLTIMREGRRAIPCLFLSPSTPAPWPGAVAVHQHNDQYYLGKSEPAGLAGDPAMAYGLALAARGVAVIVPDLIGFEERRGPWQDDEKHERFLSLNLIAEGSSVQAQHVEDVMCAVAWLESNEDIAGPLGIIGHSLGGQVAFFAAACDPRIRVVAINCGFGSVRSCRRHNVLHNPGWSVPGIIPFGDTDRICSVIREQSVYVSAGENDPYFPIDGVREAFDGFDTGVAELDVQSAGHGMSNSQRERILTWFVRTQSDAREEEQRGAGNA